jgi:HEAT repeat protein
MGLFGPPDVYTLKKKKNVSGLIKALGYLKDATIRRDAAEALRELKDPRAQPALLAALNDADQRVRNAALGALAQLGDQQAVEPLIAVMEQRDTDTRSVAALALGTLSTHLAGSPANQRILLVLVALLRDETAKVEARIAAAESLGLFGAPAVEALIAALQSANPHLRKAAAEALGVVGAPAVEALLPAVQSADPFLRKAAAEALGTIGDERAVPALLEFVLKPGTYLGRTAAGEALEQIYKLGRLSPENKRRILAKRDRLTQTHSDSRPHADLPAIPHEDGYICGQFHGDSVWRSTHHDGPGDHHDESISTGLEFPL